HEDIALESPLLTLIPHALLTGTPGPGCALSIASGLQTEQVGVAAACGEQPGVAAVLDHAPRFEHEDAVRHAHGREPVRDQDRGAPGGERAETLEHGV